MSANQHRDDRPQQPEELAGIVQSYDTMRRLIADNDDLRTQLQTSERQVQLTERRADLTERENEELRKQNKQMKGERDHYFRAFSALSAQLDGVASGLVTAIHTARTQAYGGRRPNPPLPDGERRTETPIPKFLQEGPRDFDQPTERAGSIVNMNELAEAIRAGGGR